VPRAYVACRPQGSILVARQELEGKEVFAARASTTGLG
jgi:hypothetical protein